MDLVLVRFQRRLAAEQERALVVIVDNLILLDVVALPNVLVQMCLAGEELQTLLIVLVPLVAPEMGRMI